MKEFTKNCRQSFSVKVIDNGYIVSGQNLGDAEEHYCENFLKLVNYIGKFRLNILGVGEEVIEFMVKGQSNE